MNQILAQIRTTGLIASLLFSSVFSQTLEALQDSFLTLKYGAFLHFNMGTFTGEEWATPGKDPNTFNPAQLNCGQWADAMKDAGMKYATLTTKHHDGFCLWNSAFKTYDVGSSTWKEGSGDVVREFVDSTRSRGLKVCFYYSIWDKTSGNDTTFIKNQLTELLTNYGPITALWFDGWGWQVGYAAVPYETIRNHIKSLQPECLVMENNHRKNLSNTEIMLYERNIDGMPPVNNTIPLEVCCNIRSDGNWFYHASGNCNLKSVDYLYTSLTGINQGHGNYLLDLTPDRDGLIPQCQVDRLLEFSAYKPDTTMNNQNKAAFYGTWGLSSSRGFGDFMDDLQYTRAPGDSFVFSFTGKGVDFITELNNEHGAFDIYIDGEFQKNADCTAPTGTRPAQQVVFTITGLVNGPHRLKGVYTSGTDKYGVVDAFRVLPDTLETTVERSAVVSGISALSVIAQSGEKINLGASAKNITLGIYSVQGKKVTNLSTGQGGETTLPVLPAGIYILKRDHGSLAPMAKVIVFK